MYLLQINVKIKFRSRETKHTDSDYFFHCPQVSVKSCECLNTAFCISDVNFPVGSGEYVCVCPDGFTGRRCEVDIDDCKPNPCRLGRCVDGRNSFSCICPPGMTGRGNWALLVSKYKGQRQYIYMLLFVDVPLKQ